MLGQRRHQEQLPTPEFYKAPAYIDSSSDDSSDKSDEDDDKVKVDSGDVEEVDVNSQEEADPRVGKAKLMGDNPMKTR